MSDIEPKDIEALIETFDNSDWRELHLRIGGFEIFLSKTPTPPNPGVTPALPAADPAPVVAMQGSGSVAPSRSEKHPAASGGAPTAVRDAPPHWVAVRAPNLGTFYRAPKPGAAPYVSIGQKVDAGTEVCLIEVMKLFTSVLAGAAGTVRRVLVQDAELVEYDQPLFLIEPA
jgi:acetyl-CoA carboxylase biotin carboxyl carrier protein